MFNETDEADKLSETLSDVLRAIAELECKPYAKDTDDLKILILLGKAQVLQHQLEWKALAELEKTLRHMLGLP